MLTSYHALFCYFAQCPAMRIQEMRAYMHQSRTPLETRARVIAAVVALRARKLQENTANG